jgi:acyl-CoA thioester hydrolase
MRIEIPEEKKLVYEMITPIRWGDMDAMGHVNNTVYFRYMETIRMDWFLRLGYVPSPQGNGPVVVNAFCNFYKEFCYPGDIHLKLYLSEPTRTTFESWTTMSMSGEPDQINAAGGATVMWVNFSLKKSTNLPQPIKDIILN